MRLGSISAASLAKRHDADSIAKLDQVLAILAENIEISVELAARHPGVSAIGLQHLLDAFRAYTGDVENLLPAEVASNDSYDRFITIMRRVNEHLFLAFTPETRIKLYALIVVKWLDKAACPIQLTVDARCLTKTAEPARTHAMKSCCCDGTARCFSTSWMRQCKCWQEPGRRVDR